MARDVALTGAGVAGIGGAALLTRRGLKGIAGLTKRGRAAIRSVAKSGKGAADTAKDVLDKNVRPAVDTLKQAGQNTVDATRIYADAGRVYGRAKGNLRTGIPNAYREGMKEGLEKPRKKSLASRAGAIAGAMGFEAPYGKDGRTELSSYVSDVTMSELPPFVRKTVGAFGVGKIAKMPRYGMVVKELVAKADPHNLATARAHVKQAEEGTLSAQFEAAQGKKYVLLLNDRIIDGHHHLAKAERLGVTSALDVLDLTPVRFQIALAQILRMPVVAFGQEFDPVKMSGARKRAKMKEGLRGRARNALVTGTAGGYLGQIVADGAPLKVPVPSKLLRKLGKRGGRGMFKKLPVSGGKLGVAAGAAAGLLRNPKKGTATAESVATGGSFGRGGHRSDRADGAKVTELGIKDFTGANVRRAGKMLARQQGLKQRTVSRELGRRKVMRNLSGEEAADPTMSRWKDRLVKLRERANSGIQKRQGQLDEAVARRTKSRKNAAVFGGGAYVGYKVGKGRSKDGVEPVTRVSSFARKETQFGSADQARERATGRNAAAWKAYANPAKHGRLRRDETGKVVKDQAGRAIYDSIDVPGMDLVKSVHQAAAPVVKWGGRAGNIAKDAAGAIRGEVKRDKAGRPQKREWEKDWAKREGKKIAVGAGLLAYAGGLHHNVKIPVPSKFLKKIGAKAGKGSFTKIGMRDVHEGTVRTVRRKVNEQSKKLTGSQFFPDRTFAAQLNHLLHQFNEVAEAQRVRLFEKPFSGYNEKRHARTGGLNDSFRKSYNREHGSNLKRPVTTPPSKLKEGSRAAGRRKSFCARMSGMPGATSKDGKLTPKGASLKRWNCQSQQGVTQFGYNDARDEGWDLRDPRGKSARVFAPGSQKRDRREKRWYEKIGNERKLWGAGMVVAGLTGAMAGRKLRPVKGGGRAVPANVVKGNFKRQA